MDNEINYRETFRAHMRQHPNQTIDALREVLNEVSSLTTEDRTDFQVLLETPEVKSNTSASSCIRQALNREQVEGLRDMLTWPEVKSSPVAVARIAKALNRLRYDE